MIVLALGLALPRAEAGPPTPTILYKFTGGIDGALPYTTMVLGPGNALYGGTIQGGMQSGGTVFQLVPPAVEGGTAAETTIHVFTGYAGEADGATPGSLISAGGVLYGTTLAGGANLSNGTVFELSPPASPGGTWTETFPYIFAGGNDGKQPYALVYAPDGSLYGSTGGGSAGCSAGCGLIFQLSPPSSPGGAWTKSTLYSFIGSDGYEANLLILGPRGKLYGTTQTGGGSGCNGNGCGTVFELSPPGTAGGAWTKTVLHAFSGSDGSSPLNLISGKGGALYGTTNVGGAANQGVIYSLTRPVKSGNPWAFDLIYSYAGNTGGIAPWALIHKNKSDAFVGTTIGSVHAGGTIFNLKPPAEAGGRWAYRRLAQFSKGYAPVQNLTSASNGTIYGITYQGGLSCQFADGCGTIFSFVP